LTARVVSDRHDHLVEFAGPRNGLPAEVDRAIVLGVRAEDCVDDIVRQGREQPRLQLTGEDIRLRVARGVRVFEVVLRVGDASRCDELNGLPPKLGLIGV